MKQMLSYRTVFLSQTGTGIPMALRKEFTTSVTGFINRCIEDDIPTVTVRTYPNQKPWITGNIRTEQMYLYSPCQGSSNSAPLQE